MGDKNIIKARTIGSIVRELKEIDPNTAISESLLRKLVKENAIPHKQVGGRVYLTMEAVSKYFNGDSQ